MREEKSILLFDGVCNLCSGFVRFILKRDKTKRFCFVALQSEKGKEFIERYKIHQETDSVILIDKNKVYMESDAAIKISQLLPAPWSWAVVFKIIPKNWRDKMYRWVAKNRYSWFGKNNTVCHFDDTGREISF